MTINRITMLIAVVVVLSIAHLWGDHAQAEYRFADGKADPTLNHHEVCTNWSEIAEDVVFLRYNGVRMRDMMPMMEGDSFGEAIVEYAFELPDYRTETHQKKAIGRAADRIYQECLANLRYHDGR